MIRTDKQNRILVAARGAFLRYGYRRVTMSDLAMAAGISRPALYLVFKNKEDVFNGVFEQWVDETLAEIERELPSRASPREQLLMAFELWAVRSFETVLASPEARELMDCTFDFARNALEAGYSRFEATLMPVVERLIKRRSREAGITADKTVKVLTGAVRGYKQVAANPRQLRALTAELVALWLD